MKVIATTSQSVLAVDCHSGATSVLHRGAGLYYGIARITGGFAVAARRRLVSSDVPPADERGCILLFDQALSVSKALEAPFPLRDLHQIAWLDDRLWMTCSFEDMIAIWDGSAWERWRPLEDSSDGVNDRYHFNSFFAADGSIGLLAHNHGASDVHFFDRRSRSLQRSFPLGQQAHNLWMHGDAYATCSSIEGKLVAADGWELETGGFPRGVCIDNGYRAIGISALSERGERDWTSGAIALFDASWRTLHYVHLVQEGMVLDLAPISDDEFSVIDAAALERQRFPLLSRLTDADLGGSQGSSGEGSR